MSAEKEAQRTAITHQVGGGRVTSGDWGSKGRALQGSDPMLWQCGRSSYLNFLFGICPQLLQLVRAQHLSSPNIGEDPSEKFCYSAQAVPLRSLDSRFPSVVPIIDWRGIVGRRIYRTLLPRNAGRRGRAWMVYSSKRSSADDGSNSRPV